MQEAKFFNFFELPLKPLNPHVSSRAMSGDKLMFVEHKVKKGHRAEADCHENEQLTFVLMGELKIVMNGQVKILKAGSAVLIPSNLPHEIEVLEDSVVIEVFSPPRTEWLQKLQS